MSTFLSTRIFYTMLCSTVADLNDQLFKEFDNIPRLKRRITKESFIKTFSTIYFGTEDEQKSFTFKL